MAKAVQLKDKAGNKVYAAPYFPIGSIYLSVNSTNPSTYFGGTWERMTGGFLYGCVNSPGNSSITGTSTGASSGSTGGPSTNTSGSTTLTAAQSGLPSHSHYMWNYNSGASAIDNYTISAQAKKGYNANLITRPAGGTNASQGHTHTLSSHTHSLNSHTHAIPYMAVYVWKRTA